MENTNEQKTEAKDESVQEKGADENLNERFSPIAEANLAAERLEKANKEKSRLLAIEEKMIIERKLGGTSNAGMTPAKPTEKTAKEYANEVMTGKIKAN